MKTIEKHSAIQETTLDRMPKGSKGVITAVDSGSAFRGRLLDLGLLPQTPIYVKKAAPLGDPIEIILRGYTLTLRRAEAKIVRVLPQFIQTKGKKQTGRRYGLRNDNND